MPFQIEAHDHYILIHCRGELTLNELLQIDHQMNVILNTATHRMDYIVDIEELTSAPMTALLQRKYITYIQHPRLGQTVVYGKHNGVVPVIVNSIARLVKSFRYKFVDNFAEALAYLEQSQTNRE